LILLVGTAEFGYLFGYLVRLARRSIRRQFQWPSSTNPIVPFALPAVGPIYGKAAEVSPRFYRGGRRFCGGDAILPGLRRPTAKIQLQNPPWREFPFLFCLPTPEIDFPRQIVVKRRHVPSTFSAWACRRPAPNWKHEALVDRSEKFFDLNTLGSDMQGSEIHRTLLQAYDKLFAA
jgi:hypothetical protein